jgi:hypothetical protein
MSAKFTVAFTLFFLWLFGAYGQITITLRKSFVDSLKNRITIDANYEVFFAHKHPNTAANDADLHFAGYDKKIGIPIVAEIMNAKDQTPAVDLIHQKEGKGQPQEKLKISGVWRLWCEHPGDIEEFKQGKKIAIENTNPPHVFEIHPTTKVGNIDVTNSLHHIDGFDYKDAEDAFSRYSNLRSRITKKGKWVSIETNGIGYNYVNFWIQLNATQKQIVDDGLFVFCTVYKSGFDPNEEDQDELISHKIRIGFVKDSDIFNKVKAMKKGEFLHVVGIPRIDLALIAWRVEHSSSRPEAMNWNLPFEMVALGEIQ